MAKRAKQAQTMERYSTFLRRDQLEQLRRRQEQTGVPVAEQIRRAIDAALGTTPARKGGRQ
jgi:hypothetical protein